MTRAPLKERLAALRARAGDAPANPLAAADTPAADAPLESPAPREGEMIWLRHGQIVPDPKNPRTVFDEAAIGELAESIAEHGLMQNLVVSEHLGWRDAHALVSGERRWRAIGKLWEDGRWDTDRLIPCRLITGLTPEARAVHALLENLVRRDLGPLEEAVAFRSLREDHGLDTDTIATRIGRSQRFVQQRLQLLDLPAQDQAWLAKGELTIEQARQRLANRPPPTVISDDARRLLAEMLHLSAAQGRGGGSYRSIDIARGDAASADPAYQALMKLHVVESPGDHYGEGGGATGLFSIRMITYRIAADALEALPAVSAPYDTAWLNDPLTPTPEREAWARGQAAERERHRAEREASVAAERAVLKAKSDRVQALRLIYAAARDAIAEDLTQVARELKRPLPWAAKDGLVYDAEGHHIADRPFGWGGHAAAVTEFMVIAINAAASLATPDAPAAATAPERDPEDDAGEDGFDDEDDDQGDPLTLGDLVEDLDSATPEEE